MEFKPKSKITHTQIDSPCRVHVLLPECDLERLKAEAFSHKTTVSEIIRVLVSEYLKSLDDKSKER